MERKISFGKLHGSMECDRHRPPHFQMLEKEEEHVTKALEDGHWVTHVNHKHMIAYLLITLCNFTTFLGDAAIGAHGCQQFKFNCLEAHK
jgi:hypothetical protein